MYFNGTGIWGSETILIIDSRYSVAEITKGRHIYFKKSTCASVSFDVTGAALNNYTRTLS